MPLCLYYDWGYERGRQSCCQTEVRGVGFGLVGELVLDLELNGERRLGGVSGSFQRI